MTFVVRVVAVLVAISSSWSSAKTYCAPHLRRPVPGTVRVTGHEVFWDEQPVPLLGEAPESPSRHLLNLFLESGGRPLSYAEIFAWLWPEEEEEMAPRVRARVVARVTLLRQAFYDVNTKFNWIHNDRMKGYIWRAPIKEAATLFELGDLRVTDDQVFWSYRSVPGFKSGTRDLQRRALLLRLARSANQPVSYDDLSAAIWPKDAPTTEQARVFAIKKFIAEIRQAFKKADSSFAQIRPAGRGLYVWVDHGSLEANNRVLSLNPSSAAYEYGGVVLKLNSITRRLLKTLVQSAPDYIPVKDLTLLVWGSSSGDERSDRARLGTEMSRLRSVFRKINPGFNAIHFLDEEGYAWIDALDESLTGDGTVVTDQTGGNP